jgi:hypothetical protein
MTAATTSRMRALCISLLAAVTPVASAKVTVSADADTYAMNSSAGTNYGSAATFVINSSNGIRVAYLRFDLSAVPLPAKRIVLDLFSNGVGFDSYNVYGLVSGEDWQEDTLRWNNAPGIKNSRTSSTGTLAQVLDPAALYLNGQPLATFNAPGGSNFRNRAIDATWGPVHDFIAADADKIVSFLIVEQDPLDTSGVSWHSKEGADSAFHPRLTFYHEGDAWDSLRVVILGGQSNADGRAAASTLPADLKLPQDNVPFYYHTHGTAANTDSSLGQLTTLRPGATQTPTGGYGPEITLGRDLSRLVEARTGNHLAIIKYARGGTNLHTEWKAGGDNSVTGDGAVYQTWQRVVRNGMSRLSDAFPEAHIDIAAWIWIQAASDLTSGEAASAAYEANQRAFIHDVRATIRPNLPVYLGKISDQQFAHADPQGPNYPFYLTIRAAQEAVAADTPGVHLFRADGPTYQVVSDGMHFTGATLQIMGSEFAEELARTIILRSEIQAGPKLRWNAVPGRGYHVEWSDDLLDWSRVAVGSVSEWTDPAPPAKRFYRIREAD